MAVELTFKKLILQSCSEKEFNDFMKSYGSSDENLCVDKYEAKDHTLLETLSDLEMSKKLLHVSIENSYEIWYLQGTDIKIYAFAFINIKDFAPDKVIEIRLLCSHINKIVKKDDKSLGRWLLDEIYGTLIFNTNNLLKIEPANTDLMRYYVKWKTPSINKKTFDDHATFKYLIYGNLKHTNVKCIENAFVGINYVIEDILNLKPKKTLDQIKQSLKDVVNKLDGTPFSKEKKHDLINSLKYLTADDFRAENTGAGWDDVKKGGRRKNKKTTNYKNINKKYKLTKHRNA